MGLEKQRCSWASNDLLIAYHDEEYGRLTEKDNDIFEKVCLESFSAGLSWYIVLKKRPALRDAFFGFDMDRCSRLTDAELEAAMQHDIIRNRRKVEAVRTNAQALQRLAADAGSLYAHVSRYADGKALSASFREYGVRQFGPVGAEELLKSLGILPAHEAGCAWNVPKGEDACLHI